MRYQQWLGQNQPWGSPLSDPFIIVQPQLTIETSENGRATWVFEALFYIVVGLFVLYTLRVNVWEICDYNEVIRRFWGQS